MFKKWFAREQKQEEPFIPTRRSRSAPIRASEIGVYLFCERAWWYQNQGYQSDNTSELQGGTRMHQEHGRQVVIAGLLRIAGYVLLLAALALLTINLLSRVI